MLAMGAAGAAGQPADPPARVARLNFIEGPVSFRPDSVDEWAAATPNYPLTTGDHLWTDASARAEVHAGSTALRMAPQTALQILNLDDRVAQFSVTSGSLSVHVRYLGPDETFEVDTPNVAIALLRPGDYRIDSDADSNTTSLTVWRGEAEATGGGAAFPVRPGETARIMGLETPTHDLAPAIPPNEFDQWCQARDRREDQAQISARYVPREMVGYEDLDGYGRWVNIPPYGWVWQPTAVPAGWTPYHYGHWAWVEPWGWTWIDDAPWGFAPFHYGRWAYAGGLWVWAPGAMMVGVRPVYAPALVAFVGGPRFGMSLAVGGGAMAAWFPLGPGEVFVPAYHVSEVYVRQVNIVHVTNVSVINVNVTNVHYVNMGVRGAVVAVPQEAFVGARPLARAAVVVPDREIANAQVVGTTAMVAPRRESVLGGAVARTAPPARFAERAVVVRNAPPPQAVPFAARQQALEANHGRPLDAAQMNSLRATAPARAPMVRQVQASPAERPAGGVSGARPGFVNDRPPGATAPARPQGASPAQPTRQREAETARPAARPQTEGSEARPAASPRKEPPGKKKAEKKEEKKQ